MYNLKFPGVMVVMDRVGATRHTVNQDASSHRALNIRKGFAARLELHKHCTLTIPGCRPKTLSITLKDALDWVCGHVYIKPQFHIISGRGLPLQIDLGIYVGLCILFFLSRDEQQLVDDVVSRSCYGRSN